MRVNSLGCQVQQASSVKNAKKNQHAQNTGMTKNFRSNQQITTLSASKIDLVKSKKSQAVGMISFGSAGRKGNLFLGAELPPYDKVGGVSVVMKDYSDKFNSKDDAVVIPYYNGKLKYDELGNRDYKSENSVGILMKDGKPIYTKQDLSKKTVDDLKPNEYHELEEVGRKTMQWGKNEQDEIVLLKVKGKNHFMVYTDKTATMKKPYAAADGGYGYGSGGKPISSNGGDTYAKFNKAFVEFIPELEDKGIKPKHILLSDAQTANTAEYLQEKVNSGHEAYKDLKASYIMHNIGPGYQGETSAENMFHNYANKEQIEAVEQDPDFKKAAKEGKKENYYQQFIEKAMDTKEHPAANASMIPIHYGKQGAMNLDTVTELYAESAAHNNKVAIGLTQDLQEGMKNKWFGGILNPFGDLSFNPEKEIFMGGAGLFDKEVKRDGVTYKPFETFKKNAPIDDIIKTKQKNAKNMFQRLSSKSSDVAAGIKGKNIPIIGHIDQKWSKQVDKFLDGDKSAKVDVFTSWGRGDFQKGLDIVVDAFKQHVQSGKGKNSVLILGGPDSTPEIIDKMKDAAQHPDLKGRMVFMDGFAPNKPLASIADSCIFASRFAPCELTDYEAMQQGGASPIVTGSQGLAQKNFDPRNPNEVDKATGYKTKSEFYMPEEKLKELSAALGEQTADGKPSNYQTDFDKLVEKQETSLRARGVKEEVKIADAKITRKAYAEGLVKKSEDFSKLYTKWADKVLAKEFAEAMNEKVRVIKEEPQLNEKMIRNSLNVQTNWENNQALHPSGKSTMQMYNERHFNSDKKFEKGGKRVFNFTKEKLAEIKDRIAKAADEIKDNVSVDKNTSEKATKSGGKTGKIVGITLGAVAVVGGAFYAMQQKAKKAAANNNFQRPMPRNNVQNNSFQQQRRPYAPTYQGRTAS